MKFNEKLDNIPIYTPVTEVSRIRLNANESYFEANKRMLMKIKKAVGEIEFNRYPDPSCKKLREAFGKCFKVKPEQVVCGNGSDELINLIVQTFSSKGETVVVSERDFSMYAFYAKLMECEVVKVPNLEDFSADVEALVLACREKRARLLLFSNPCNPTSQLLDRRTVSKIVSSLPDTLVVLDEAYMDFAEESMLAEVKKFDNLILLKTLSKAFGLAAIRLGFAVSNKRIAEILNATRSPYNVNALTQAIGAIALGARSAMEFSAEQLLDSRAELFEGLKKFEAGAKGDFSVMDGETNFVLVQTSKVKQIDAYLKKRGISVRSFEDTLRITAGSEEENAELLRALEEISTILWI